MFKSPGPIALEVGPIIIFWYGIIIALAFLAGLAVTVKIAKKQGENPDKILNLAIFLLLGAIIGARLYFVLFNWGFYKFHLQEIFMTWHGGLSIHGAIIGGFITGAVYTKLNKLPLLKYADFVSPGLILGQAIGRWGNFFNSEAFGFPTDLPWKLYIPIENRPPEYLNYQYFHPTFLYESIWNFTVFLLLFFVFRKKFEGKNGSLFFIYLILYSLGRFIVEGFRVDNIYIILGMPIAKLMSIIFIIIGILGLYFVKYYTKCARQ
ncbi:MAG: prolipoprotein diacylglyceryl transferase [Candidatus Gastranaerophilales bacterium]|nr:prolipoprotein diacylglyceryl transferase [Candidatus Gastranaerophilales bacterium]